MKFCVRHILSLLLYICCKDKINILVYFTARVLMLYSPQLLTIKFEYNTYIFYVENGLMLPLHIILANYI